MKYKIIVPESRMIQMEFNVEAETEEDAVRMVKEGKVSGKNIGSFSNYDGTESLIWEDASIYKV